MTLQDHGDSGWYIDTDATSHLASDTSKLTSVSNKSIISSILVGNSNLIPVTITGHSMLPTLNRPLDLHNVLVTPNIIKNLISVRQFTIDNSCSIKFDPFGFTVKDLWTRHLLLRCNSKGDLYPVLPPTSSPTTLLSTNQSTWHQRLGHPGNEVFCFQKSLYGLKQASRAWFQRFSSYAIRVGFIHNKTDSSLFVYQQGTKTAYLLLYVDAISLYMVSKDQTNQPISLFERFPMISNSSRVAYIAPATTINPVISNSSSEVIAANTWEDDSSPQGYEDKGNLRQEFKTSGGFVEQNNWDGKWDHPWESDEDPQVNTTTDDFPLNQDYKANGMEENKWGGEWEQPWGSDVNAQANTTTNHTDFLHENTWEESQPVSATTDKVELIETEESESSVLEYE
ncbi:ribonuclease H-like domain-containing protein [Tanacetum coccineum]